MNNNKNNSSSRSCNQSTERQDELPEEEADFAGTDEEEAEPYDPFSNAQSYFNPLIDSIREARA